MTGLETVSDKVALLNWLHEIDDLESAGNLLLWDQSTYMPPRGAPARSRQSATLRRIAHQKLVDPEIGSLLAGFERYADKLPYDSDDAALARVVRRMYDRAVRVPAAFMAEFAEHTSATYSIWAKARPANDFLAVKPYLEKTLELSQRYAEYFPDHDHIADPLIDRTDFGMTVADIRPIFTELRSFLSQLTKEISAVDQVAGLPAAPYDIAMQRQTGVEIVERFGYDFSRGRLDDTHHPFMIKFSLDDVRITSRFFKENLSGIFSTMHEAGHAMYEQGIDRTYERTPLADGTSSAVHESQSRMWENIVGRSRAFWEWCYPSVQERFAEPLRAVSLDAFYGAINRVAPSLIRVDADEVTYGLHVIIRFELELELLEGKLTISELPEAWNAKYGEYLGVTPPDDRDGVMQDVHWYTDFIGGVFQGYLLGTVLASQFFAAALESHPEIPAEIERGKFDTLLTWLTDNIYRYGSKYTTHELVARITGGPIDIRPYQRYLRSKFGEIYSISQGGD